MNENIISFGPGSRLTGTLTRPLGTPRATAVLLLNAGVIHRMGPHRINVKLARALAEQGFTVFRFDLSGQGDSAPPESGLPYEQQAVLDIQAAMDHLQRAMSLHSFALAGICSAAHHGVSVAAADDRLKALWLMDTHTYPNARTKLVRTMKQLQLDLTGTLLRWAGKIVSIIFKHIKPGRRDALGTQQLLDNAYPSPSISELATRMQVLIDKRIKVQLVFSGGMFWRFNYEGQWRDTFKAYPDIGALPCTLISELDHTASTLQGQRHLIESVKHFLAPLN